MIDDRNSNFRSTVPLLLRFAEPLPETVCERLRYDEERQISQIEVNGIWIDTPGAASEVQSTTRVTRVQAETTDDN